MFKNISTILIWSENYKALADWYEKTLQLPVIESLNHPKDTGILFKIGKTQLWIGQHSEIKGKSKDPLRIMFNIDVDSVEKAYQYLLSKGVHCIAKPFKAPTFAKYFTTFSDPEGNVFQLIGGK